MAGDSHSTSVTVWIEQLRAGDPESASKLWERFFDQLVSYARQQMKGANRRVADEEARNDSRDTCGQKTQEDRQNHTR